MNLEPTLHRRLLQAGAAALLALAGLVLAGCGSSPPLQLHHLPLPAPETASASAPALAPAPSAAVWELVTRTALPAYLDRDQMLVDRGQGRVEALPGQRWAEPLAEAVPRLLLHDLTLVRGAGQVWPAPAPPAAGSASRLRVEVTALQAEPAAQRLRLQARWTLEARGATPGARAGTVDLNVPLPQADAGGLVQAHRLALWRLAQRLAVEAVP